MKKLSFSNKCYFCSCWEGAWMHEYCQEGLLFDGRLGYCNWKSAVKCRHSLSNTSSTTTVQTTSATTPSTLGPRFVVTFSTPEVSTRSDQANQSTTPLTHLNETMSTTASTLPKSGALYLRRKQPGGHQVAHEQKQTMDLQMGALAPNKSEQFIPCPQPTGQFVDKQNCSFYYK